MTNYSEIDAGTNGLEDVEEPSPRQQDQIEYLVKYGLRLKEFLEDANEHLPYFVHEPGLEELGHMLVDIANDIECHWHVETNEELYGDKFDDSGLEE